MKIPAKIEYAYKAVLELAARYNGQNPIQIGAIAETQDIPKKFLIQLLLQLKSSHIVDSSRGVSGGYFLARPPSEISLADVFKAVDDTILDAAKEIRTNKRSGSDRLILAIWSKINRDIAVKLESVTFDKLLSDLKSEEITYSI